MSMEDRQFKDAIYAQLARLGKALASPKRLELLDLLVQGPRTVEVLADAAALSVANASQHLQALRAARLVEAQKKGLFVTYRVADAQVTEFFREIRLLAEQRLAEMDQIVQAYHTRGAGLEGVDRKNLLRRVREGAVTVLDVRPREEFRAGHIPGAVSIPLGALRRRLKSLLRDQEIVAYCRGPYCVLAIKAVALLRKKGFKAIRLEDSVPDWRARGLPVAVGA